MKKILQIMGFTGLILIIMGGLISLIQLAMGGKLDQLGQRISEVVSYHLLAGVILLVIGVLANQREIRDYLARSRRVRVGPNIILQAGLFLLILVFINVLAYRHDKIKDFTKLKLYQLRPVTKTVMKGLPGEVEVMAFFRGIADDEARRRLQVYAAEYPDKMKLKFIDPDKNEDLAFKENIPRQEGILFKFQGKREWITAIDEDSITNAFIRVTRERRGKVWFIKGHGEPELELSLLRDYLVDQGFQIETVTLLRDLPQIPEDVSVIALIGSQLSLSPHEFKLIDDYLQNGGSAFIALDFISFSGLEQYLTKYGLKADNNLIRDLKNHIANSPGGTNLVITDLAPNHEISGTLSFPTLVFPNTRSFTVLNEEQSKAKGVQLTHLAWSSEDSFERKYDTSRAPTPESLHELFISSPREGENSGPFVLAYAINQNLGRQEAGRRGRVSEVRIVVVGTSYLCRNLFINMPYNWQFALNSFNWLAGEKDLVRLRAPTRGGTRLDLDRLNENVVFYLTVIILPEAFMILGVAVWWRRR